MKKYTPYSVMTILLWMSLMFIFSGFSYRADITIGYIQTPRLFAEYSKIQEAKQTLDEERTALMQDLQSKQAELEQKYKEYESQKLLMSASRKKEFEDEMGKLEMEIRQFQSENFAQGGTLDQRWAEITQPILDNAQTIINQMAVDEGYDLIIDAKDGFVVYGRDDLDLTDRVLELLEAEK